MLLDVVVFNVYWPDVKVVIVAAQATTDTL